MTKKTINYITNIVGVAVISLSFYEYFYSKDWGWFIGLIVVGFSLLVFENKTLQGVLKGFVGMNKKRGFTIDPDREYPDDRG